MRIRTTVEKLAHVLGRRAVGARGPLASHQLGADVVVEVELNAFVEWQGDLLPSHTLLTALLLLLNHPERP